MKVWFFHPAVAYRLWHSQRGNGLPLFNQEENA
jgi:hypothetical protein